MTTARPSPDAIALTADEQAAVRAYLQRSEVRLSTVHRVATALLSGAGLMVLLPVVGRDAVVDVVRHLLSGEFDVAHALLTFSVLAALTVPVMSLLVVLRDLTQFYFHANHLNTTFAPRFTLTGLRMPHDELGPDAAAALDHERSSAQAVELLVPDNDVSRAMIDERIGAYGIGASVSDAKAAETDAAGSAAEPATAATAADRARAEALFEMAASRPRPLLDEVAKVEHGMVRHIIRIQMIVLRYVKALLALLTTALAVFAGAAVVEGKAVIGPSDEAWLAGAFMVWAPVVILAVCTPVRWLEILLRSEGATDTVVGQDRAFTHIDDVTVSIALVGFLAAAVVMGISLGDSSVSDTERVVGALATVGALVGMASTLHAWGGQGGWRRVGDRLRPGIGR